MQDSKIQEKLEATKKQRDELVAEANRRIAMLSGAIVVLEELLAVPAPVDDTEAAT